MWWSSPSLLTTGALLLPLCLAGGPPYSEYVLAPSSRTIYPAAIYRTNGTVTSAQSLLSSAQSLLSSSAGNASGSAIFKGNSSITFDYGKNIGGIVTLTVGSVSSPNAVLGVTFTESSLWINGAASDATADAGLDSPLWFTVGNGPGTYTVGREFDRGAFRYLSVVSNSSGTVEVQSVEVEFTAAPEQEDLTAYTGYFHSNDELLNRIWYAGAYTCQICSIDPTLGNSLIWINIINSTQVIELPETIPWYNNYTITSGKTALVDGAKRDRLVWPGDIVVAAPSMFVSTGDMLSIRNALDSLLALQNSSGALPYAGSPFQEIVDVYSFTYHLHGLLDLGLYYDYTEDVGFLQNVWKNFMLGLEFTLGFVDGTGLLNVTTSSDWLRVGMGGHNIEANAILYYTLNKGIELANVLNDSTSATTWALAASKVKTAANTLLWDDTSSLYLDNETTTLHPQDGNAWAVLANLTLTSQQNTAITAALRARWGPYGAPAPEAGSTPATISPFIGYFEATAHYTSNNATAAHELLRRQWGFMLDDPRMTNSTFIEGYAADGGLAYAPYTNDARVSHAHGWSTGPTSLLTFRTAGLSIAAAGGRKWTVAPRLGGLTSVEAGFSAPAGSFSIEVQAEEGAETVSTLEFSTPVGTVGTVSLPGVVGSLRNNGGDEVALVDGEATEVPGGQWILVVS